MHSASKIQMGTTRSSFKNVDNVPGAIAAGLAVRAKSDGTFTTAEADGSLVGISLGRSQSDTSRTAVCRKGTEVPLLCTDGFTPTVGAAVKIDATTGKASTGGTTVNAIYRAVGLTVIDEDGTETASIGAIIDFPGGL
jgi:hypothetical protein